LLAGARTITEHVDGRPLSLTPLGFFQVNPAVLEQLALRAAAIATSRPVLSVVDLYCGGGVLGLTIAQRAGCSLLGVDVGAASIESARRDAKVWGVDATFAAGTPESSLTDLPNTFFGPSELGRRILVLDPPRSGCRPDDLAAALALRPDLVIYVSCHTAGQARDAVVLLNAGWTPRTLVPADMLPQTPHVEWLAIWDRV
jgi:23S rRNA (uracil1939-C5)-methyltransferase